MNDTVVFRNFGLIDLNVLRILGANVKQNARTAIGYFGTGLKFAIAQILRTGGQVTLWRGQERYEFKTATTDIRGREFSVICMNEEKLAFTTEFGKNWESWMAVREFITNTLDEDGQFETSAHIPNIVASENETVFVITSVPFFEAFKSRHTFVLPENRHIIARDADMEMCMGGNSKLFYKRIRVHDCNPHRTLFTWNAIGAVSLTEDRFLRNPWEFMANVSPVLLSIKDAKIIDEILSCRDNDVYEHRLSYNHCTPSAEFAQALAHRYAQGIYIPSCFVDHAQKIAQSTFGELSAYEMTSRETLMLDKAQTILKKAGFNISKYPLRVVEHIGQGIHGIVRDRTIVLSTVPFQKGTREVAATLLEEFAHLESGASDETREFQNYLFDQLLCQIENATKELF